MTVAQMDTAHLVSETELIFSSFGPVLYEALSANVATVVTEDIGMGDRAGLLILADRHAHVRVIVCEYTVLCGIP